MVKVQRKNTAAQEQPSHRTHDIVGLLLFFIGAAGLLCLSWPQPGLLPGFVDNSLRLLAGVGAYLIPILFLFAGTMFLIGYQKFTVSHTSIGSLLLYFVFLASRHLTMVHPASAFAGEQVKSAGGLLGGLIGAGLNALMGIPISSLFLITLSLVAVVLIIDQPLIVLMRQLKENGKQRALAAGQLLSRPPDSTKMLASGTPGRAGRGKKIAEEAVVAAPRRGGAHSQTVPEMVSKPAAEISSLQKLLRMFRLTRDLNPEEDEIPEDDSLPEARETAVVDSIPTPRSRRTATTAAPAPAPGLFDHEDADTVVTPSAATKTAVLDRVPDAEAAEGTSFTLPPLNLLKETPPATARRTQNELQDNIHTLEQTLEQFNIGATVVEVASGPSVTRYEIQLAPGIKVSKIVSLADNIAMNLAAIDVRVEAPIPGKAAIGVEVPNAHPMLVSLRECLDTDEFRNAPSLLTFALGKDVSGSFKYADLTRMPHLLIGGSTNSGKSVCLNVIIASLLYRASPREVKLLMIDPKRVELSLWDGIPHLMHPVVKDVKLAAGIFRAALKEMDRRYDLFSALGTRNIDGYNAKVPESEKLPFIVLIVDELADLMMQQGPEIETSICRLAQLARATGIHLVIATQRPSVDIITGTIKANISSRIAFAVASQVDSRTILDSPGADRLIGRGDMLFMPIDANKPLRIQGCYLSETETNSLVDYLKTQEKPDYSFTLSDTGGGDGGGRGAIHDDDVDDEFFEQAVRLVVNNGQASTSMLQRRFRIGYTRAARIVEMMEEKGLVGPLNGAKPREITVSRDEVERMFNPGGVLPSVAEYQDEGE